MQLDGRHVLMLNPGFNEMGEALDSQNHPFGMLRAAAWLKSIGHTVDMIDCGLPPRVDQSSDRLKERHHGKPVKMLPCGHWQGEGIWKTQMYYGQPMTAIRNAMAQQRPDEIWVGSGLTYHWETTAELVQIAREMFPSTRIRVGGIYPTLCPDHARRVCDGAEVWAGEIPEAREFWPDYSVYPHTVPFRTVKWNEGCLPPHELVLTHKGYIPIEDVRAGDRVLARGSFRRVEIPQRRRYNGTMRTLQTALGSGLQMDLTNNHRVETYNRGVIQAGSLRPGDLVKLSLPKRSAVDWTADEAYVMGWYMGDGSISHANGIATELKDLRFALGYGDTDAAKRLVDILGHGAKAARRRSARVIDVRAYDHPLIPTLLRNIGRGSKTKFMSPRVLYQDDVKTRAFLRGYFEADGHVGLTKPYAISAGTASRSVAMGVCLLLMKLGYHPLVTRSKSPKSSDAHYVVSIARREDVVLFLHGVMQRPDLIAKVPPRRRHIVRRPPYEIRGDEVLLPITHVADHQYEGYVHNLQVEGVHKYTGAFEVENCTVAKACSFCAVKYAEPKFRWRGGESLEDYVEQALHEGVRHIRIWASQLLQPPKAFMDLMERLYRLQLKHGVPFQLYASEGVQPSLFTPAMANAMVRAGFHTINIPMESIDPETLKQFNKPSGLDDYYRAVQIAKEAGFSFIGAFIMVGTPQQSLEEIVHAIVDCWYRRISPTIMKYTIIPGSQDWEDHAWVHEGKDLHHLHPSLWPGAREDLSVRELEELTYIARIGYAAWSRLPQEKVAHFQGSGRRTASRVDRLFMKWCRIYGLVKNGRYRDLDVATPHEPPSGRHRTTLRDSAWTSGQHVALTL